MATNHEWATYLAKAETEIAHTATMTAGEAAQFLGIAPEDALAMIPPVAPEPPEGG